MPTLRGTLNPKLIDYINNFWKTYWSINNTKLQIVFVCLFQLKFSSSQASGQKVHTDEVDSYKKKSVLLSGGIIDTMSK
jgi:hypothetical protein